MKYFMQVNNCDDVEICRVPCIRPDVELFIGMDWDFTPREVCHSQTGADILSFLISEVMPKATTIESCGNFQKYEYTLIMSDMQSFFSFLLDHLTHTFYVIRSTGEMCDDEDEDEDEDEDYNEFDERTRMYMFLENHISPAIFPENSK
jgi:hypothetical protein